MNETRALARFVAQTKFTDLPRGLVDNLKITVLDTIGAGFVGAGQPWAQRIVAVRLALRGTPEASHLQQDLLAEISLAVRANGGVHGPFLFDPLIGARPIGAGAPCALE